MSLKSKILLLSLLPLILMTGAILIVTGGHVQALADQEIKTFESNLMAAKRAELKNLVDAAMQSIKHVRERLDESPEEAQQAIRDILTEMTYGDDGYYFAYTPSGTNLVHPIQPELVGKNLYDLQDQNGKYVIRSLLTLANEGGGYYRYHWRKPSKTTIEEKLSYVVIIPELGWMMGTGVYIDDIAAQVKQARLEVDRNVRNSLFTILMILLGTMIVIVLLGIAINVHATSLANARLREVVHKYVQFQINQRRNFARELHDGINQLMVSVKFKVELAMEQLDSHPSKAYARLDEASHVLNRSIREVRRISHDLRPSMLDDLGLETALVSLKDDFCERTGIESDLKVKLPEHRLPDDIEITVYRIVQEALINIEKHAKASHVSLTLEADTDGVVVNVIDDGVGFDLRTREKTPYEGIGLTNMRERAEILGGSFSIKSRAKVGTRVTATFSLEPSGYKAPEG